MASEKKQYSKPVVLDLGDAAELTAGFSSGGSETIGVCLFGYLYWENSVEQRFNNN